MESRDSKHYSKPLVFRPESEGLGFHPFSDGLPYAPLTKTSKPAPRPMGTGAVSAGPIGVSPRISVPVRTQAPVIQRQPAPAPASPLAAISVAPSYGMIYVLKRVLAFVVDSSLNTGLSLLAFSLALLKQGLTPDALLTPGVVALAVLFLAVFNWALVTAQEIAFGTSVGKRLFGLVLDGSTSALFLRAFFFLPSAGFCGIGLIWGLFNRNRRCWHDLAVGVQPIEIARL